MRKLVQILQGKNTMTPLPSIEASCKTDTGLVRARNEDVCFVDTEKHYYMVADGMGGAAGGDIASSLFRQAADEIFTGKKELTPGEKVSLTKQCFNLAHSKIHQYVFENPDFMGMGCTADLLTFSQGKFVIGHVGDSRTYLFSKDRLTQLTNDHSLHHEQLRAGILHDSRGAKNYSNVLLQAVGVDMKLDVDIVTGPMTRGSTFMLCSDGLYNMVKQEDIVPVLAYDGPLDLKAEILVNMANDNGGKDNISVSLVSILD